MTRDKQEEVPVPDTEPSKISVAANGGVRPVPDPTILTTQLVDKGIAGLREILLALLNGQKDVFEARLDAMDKAIRLLQSIADRMPAEVDGKVANLRTLHDEKFASIQTQFRERDTRTEQSSKDSKVAVDAALQAAKEAVGEQNKSSALAIAKSETATTKQIDQLVVLISTATKGLETTITDVKDRLNRIEGEGRGQDAAKTTQQTSNISTVGIIGLVLGSLIGVGGLLVALMR